MFSDQVATSLFRAIQDLNRTGETRVNDSYLADLVNNRLKKADVRYIQYPDQGATAFLIVKEGA